mgnify:CR=1 FL=1
MKKIASVAVLPFPLTAAALFGYGILRFLGYISETTHTRFTRVSSSYTGLFGCQGRIVNLHCNKLHLEILELLKGDGHLKRILTFAAFGNQLNTKSMHSRLVSALFKLNTSANREALAKVSTFIGYSSEDSSSGTGVGVANLALAAFVMGASPWSLRQWKLRPRWLS